MHLFPCIYIYMCVCYTVVFLIFPRPKYQCLYPSGKEILMHVTQNSIQRKPNWTSEMKTHLNCTLQLEIASEIDRDYYVIRLIISE